jgi:hypothetical protein
MNLFPLSRCASAVKSTRPVELICDEQPHVQPYALRLSAMISNTSLVSIHNVVSSSWSLRRMRARS